MNWTRQRELAPNARKTMIEPPLKVSSPKDGPDCRSPLGVRSVRIPSIALAAYPFNLSNSGTVLAYGFCVRPE